MKRNQSLFLWLFIVVLIGFFPLGCGAQQTEVAESADQKELRLIQENAATIDSARVLIQNAMVEQQYPGLSVAVSLDGVEIWAEGFGFSDIKNAIPVSPDSKFRIGSISKPFTAAAVAKLVAAGRLDLDAPVQQYVPDFPQKQWPITTRQLGGHLAGIRHYRGNEMMSSTYYPTVKDGLAIFANDNLLHEPGSAYLYSSYGWNLISAVVEGAAEQDFLTFVHEQVFSPLAMTHSEADMASEPNPTRVHFYEKGLDGAPEPSPYVDNSYKWAGGGFLSTPSDILKFANAHLADNYLSAETKEWLFTSQKTADGTATNYGFGWTNRTDEKGRTLLGHTGGSVGGTSIFEMNPERKLVVALTINQSSANLQIGRQLTQLFLNSLEVEKP